MIHGFFGRHQFSQWLRTVATVRRVTLGTKSLPSEHANVRVIRGRHETFLSLRLGTQLNGSARHTKHQRLQASGPTGARRKDASFISASSPPAIDAQM